MLRTPIVIVLGATGTGKSKLAIQIAKMFNGEIISADSMQVYEGLDIMSNKVTQSERKEVPHYLLDICQPLDQFTVLDFRNRSLSIIQDIVKRRKLPIVVGGTNYYIESILWNTLVEDVPNDKSDSVLYFQRCRVMKNADAVNPWKTYVNKQKNETNSQEKNEKLSVENEKKKEEEEKVVIEEKKSNADPIWLIDDLERMIGSFEDSVRDVIRQFKISEELYKRTFYQVPNFMNKTELKVALEGTSNSDDKDERPFEKGSNKLVDDADEVDEQNSINANIIRVERKLMEEFMCQCLKPVILYANEVVQQLASGKFDDHKANDEANGAFTDVRHPAGIWNVKNVDNLLGAHRSTARDAQTESRLQHQDEDHPRRDLANQLQKLKEICQCCGDVSGNLSTMTIRGLLRRLYELANQAMDMRLTRLKLIQVVDDTNMVHFSNEILYSQLEMIDEHTAHSIHPNNRRKVLRALAIFMSSGRTVKQINERQRKKNSDLGDDYQIRFPNALLLWLQCDQDILDMRLHKRVDEMVKMGLIKELEQFHERYNAERLKQNCDVDYTKGVYQSIGLKEFHRYLMLSTDEKHSPVGYSEMNHAVNRLKRTNVQYSKSQCKFIKNKFVDVPPSKEVPMMFELDCSNTNEWEENVESIALNIVDSYLKGDQEKLLSYAPIQRTLANPDRFIKGQFKCDLCDVIVETRFQWVQHIKSPGHRKVTYRKKVRELQDKIRALGPSKPKENYDVMEFDDWSTDDLETSFMQKVGNN